MRHPLVTIAAACGCALALASPASASPGMFVGAAEDAARSVDPVHADAKMALARLAGFDAIRVTSIWRPGLAAPTEHELEVLRTVALAAQVNGVRVILSVYHEDQRTTPLTARARAEFASYVAAIARDVPAIADFIVGNEPNLNRFWMPQFDRRGRTASAAAYLRLLAATYDAVKAVAPDANVVGGSLAPRGGDNPRSRRHTHSPVRFIAELGKAYRASRRTAPVMDAFAFHPYLIPSRLPPTFRFKHPRNTTIALSDYGKLQKALRGAFDGTAQPGSTLPIVYDEFGYQSVVPPEKEERYTHLDAPAAQDAIDELTQARYYARSLAIAQCQPNVTGMLLFHVTDEFDARAWQSGVYYADDTPKSSLPVVRDAALKARGGVLKRCARKRVNPLRAVVFPADAATREVGVACELPCRYVARIAPAPVSPVVTPLERLLGPTSARVEGTAEPLGEVKVAFDAATLAPGTYQYVVRVFEVGRPGTAVVRFSEPFTVAETAPVPSAP